MTNVMIIKHFAGMLCKYRQKITKCDDDHIAIAPDLGEQSSGSFCSNTQALVFKKIHYHLDSSEARPFGRS